MANPVLDMISARRGPRLAVDFRADEIALFALEDDGEWKELTAFRVDAPDFAERAAQMRRFAVKRTGADKPGVDIWLPRDQVASLEVTSGDAAPKAAALAAFTDGREIAAEDLVIDITAHEGAHAASAVERRVVAEAQDYVRKWGFIPLRVTTSHGHKAFSTGPTFARAPSLAPLAIAGAGTALLVAAGLVWLAFSGGEDRKEAVASDPPEPTAVVVAEAPPQDAPTEVVETAPPITPATPEREEPAQRDEPAQESAEEATSAPTPPVSIAELTPSAATDGDLVAVVATDPLAALPDLRPVNPVSDVAAKRPTDLRLSDLSAVVTARVTPADPLAALNLDDDPPEGSAPDAPVVVASLGDAPTAPVAAAPPQAFEAEAPPPEEIRTPEEKAAEAERRDLSVTSDPRAPAPPEQEEDVYAPGPGAVAASPSPLARPDSLDMTPSDLAVAAAPAPAPRPKSIRPRAPTATDRGEIRAVSRPQRGPPAGPGVANAATLKDAIELERMNLIGVFGSGANRRALLRLANGDVMRVTKGTVVEGWTISRIDKASMRITKGGQSQTLSVVR